MKAIVTKSGKTVTLNHIQMEWVSTKAIYVAISTKQKRMDIDVSTTVCSNGITTFSVDYFHSDELPLPEVGFRLREEHFTSVELIPTTPKEKKLFENAVILKCSWKYGGSFYIVGRAAGQKKMKLVPFTKDVP